MHTWLFLVLSAAAQVATPVTVVGRYEAVTQADYSVTLVLQAEGRARFEFANWTPDGSAPDGHEQLSGTWTRSGQVLSVQLSSGKHARYTIVPCLSYKEFDQTGCSPGLSLLATDLPDLYGLKRFGLWEAKALRQHAML